MRGRDVPKKPSAEETSELVMIGAGAGYEDGIGASVMIAMGDQKILLPVERAKHVAETILLACYRAETEAALIDFIANAPQELKDTIAEDDPGALDDHREYADSMIAFVREAQARYSRKHDHTRGLMELHRDQPIPDFNKEPRPPSA